MNDEFGGNVDNTASGEYEKLSDLRDHFTFCASPTDIECRLAIPPHSMYDEAGQVVVCSLSLGLSCHHSDNTPPICKDYEVRVYCQTPCPTTAVVTSETPAYTITSTSVFEDGTEEPTSTSDSLVIVVAVVSAVAFAAVLAAILIAAVCCCKKR
ncbi:mucin-2-like isoform X2 [Ptychodera flava]